MSAALRQRILVDSATQDLWRVAETNEVEELEHVLPFYVLGIITFTVTYTSILPCSFSARNQLLCAHEYIESPNFGYGLGVARER